MNNNAFFNTLWYIHKHEGGWEYKELLFKSTIDF